jgi:hypothetical protein
LDEEAARWEAIGGGTAYLVVVMPSPGGVMVDRLHPDGGKSGAAYGALTQDGRALREILDRFRTGSSHPGEW